ncbi:MAG: pyruvate, phosphate dikinase [Bauldia sp.]|nr:pyruvate, phosphate dikinase [Bauldia sp.]
MQKRRPPARRPHPARHLVRRFGYGGDDGPATADLLGAKGAGLAAMAALGLPVPPGFVLTTEFGRHSRNADGDTDGLEDIIADAVAGLEAATGRRLGDPERPLLLAVRGGSRVSMPGLLDTILNVGLTEEVAAGLARADQRFAFDTFRRFIQSFSDRVLGLDGTAFEDRVAEAGARPAELRSLCRALLGIVAEETGEPFPTDSASQLRAAIRAVLASWDGAAAKAHRRLHLIPDDWGIAVTVQAMVFGNTGPSSGTGFAVTRDPQSGRKALSGEFLFDAQGDDVVARATERVPILDALGKRDSLARRLPDVFAGLIAATSLLERRLGDMQEIEFTVEDGRLHLLQTRPGRRSAGAGVRIAVEMALEGLISRDDALLRIDPASLDELLHPTIAPNAKRDVLAVGLPASPGAASGEIVFSADEAEAAPKLGRRVILVRTDTSPEDVHGMHGAQAILTARGGLTSHAAMVARGMGKPCITGASEIRIDMRQHILLARGRTLRAGDVITIDGSTGQVLSGEVPTRHADLSPEFTLLLGWADQRRRLGTRANAETPEDAEAALRFGAEGIGLCRSEQMFFAPERRPVMLEMILAETIADRRKALDRLLPVQRQDFLALFRIMRGRPVTVRLIDPPLHEFLPRQDDEIAALAETMGMAPEYLRNRIEGLSEFNPMLGHRGVRVAITYPEIIEMQTRAILEAALDAGAGVAPEIMVPLVLDRAELDAVIACISQVAEAIAAERGAAPAYTVGTMIELPRAALMAGDIARSAAFFSFGTNDLTQTTLGISRDDSAAFLGRYARAGILARDPFVTIDRDGVGELVRIGVERGRAARPDLILGACGEHGGDPASIAFFAEVGLDYVSSSPFRVPIARLAAAQAAIRSDRAAGQGSEPAPMAG